MALVIGLMPGISRAQFQPSPVTPSKERTIIDGKVYYIHTVHEGQTFFSICRAYEADRETVLLENPGLDPENLKPGQAIRIPGTAIQTLTPYPVNRDDFYEHRVRRRQTVYSIARRYNIDLETIYYYNPWARNGIQTDQTLWIPRTGDLSAVLQEPEDTVAYFYYTVKEKDTLYSISRHYSVSVADIIHQNPVLRKGLQPGQTLMIPKPKTLLADTTVTSDSLVTVENCIPVDYRGPYNVALLLPFFADHIMESLQESEELDTLDQEGPDILMQVGMSFTEFYEGFLLAVDSLRKTGLSVNLHLYDTERNIEKLILIQRELLTLQPDLIIGPVYTENMSMVSRMADYQDVNIVSPLSTNQSLITSNERLFQVVPSKETESLALAGYLQQFENGRFLLLRGTDSLSLNDSWRFKTQMMAFLSSDSANELSRFKDYVLNDTLLDNLDRILSEDEENLVIVFSNNEADVGRLVSRLYVISGKYPVRLFGQPEWQVWQGIDLDYIHKLQLTLFTPFYTDFSSKATADFLRKCRSMYRFEPYTVSPQGYNYCMLGYDIGFYFLSALKMYGRNFQNCLHHLDSGLLLSDYRFLKTESGGYMNRHISFIRYNPDYTVEKTSSGREKLAEQHK
ncbi:MAG: LysM peptidoglycan-binding domain-containing protein [Bacteroidales bacterium]|nr:LysM peptidoglycan-binding domain-containing protein [Bacteroidales bacterium]